MTEVTIQPILLGLIPVNASFLEYIVTVLSFHPQKCPRLNKKIYMVTLATTHIIGVEVGLPDDLCVFGG